jgi:hexaprenyl-diphosphate synthase
MIARGYQRPGDAERALEIVRGSDGIARTTALAMEHSRAAIAAAEQMAPSVTRDALVQLAHLVVKRIS